MRRCLGLLPLLLALAALSCRGSGAPHTVDGQASAPASPAVADGLLIARTEGIALRNMRDSSEHLVKRGAANVYYTYPRWSPDGTRIAYAVNTRPGGAGTHGWGADVAVSAPDGSNEQLVFKHTATGTSVEGLAWAADGRALYLGLSGPEAIDPRIPNSQIKIDRLDPASGARTTIAPAAAYPAVSPDGRRVAFLSYGGDGLPGGLWTADPEGGDRQLLLRAANTGDRFAGLRAPRFSPDGARIAFGAVLAEAAAATPVTCTTGRRWPWEPRPAFAHGAPIDIWVVAAGGGTPERLAALSEDDPEVAWSPDGQQLAVVGACGLYMVGAAGGAVRRLGAGATQSQIDWR